MKLSSKYKSKPSSVIFNVVSYSLIIGWIIYVYFADNQVVGAYSVQIALIALLISLRNSDKDSINTVLISDLYTSGIQLVDKRVEMLSAIQLENTNQLKEIKSLLTENNMQQKEIINLIKELKEVSTD